MSTEVINYMLNCFEEDVWKQGLLYIVDETLRETKQKWQEI